jgi:hypothetical protein
VLLGCCLSFVAGSFLRLWELKRPRDRFMASDDLRLTVRSAPTNRGNFWELLGELTSPADNRSAPQGPDGVVTAPPAAAGWRNVRTTLLVLAAGAGLGCLAWALQYLPPLVPLAQEGPAGDTS